MIDVPAAGGVATVVTMADGTTSMYTSTGGGTLGAGSHEPVARASGALLAELQELIEMFPADERTSLPAADLVQITIVTREGRRRANLPAAAFWGREPSTLVALIGRIHEVIAAIRATEPA